MKYYADYVGCERRKLDTQRIIDFMAANSHKRVVHIEEAELIILITCGFCAQWEDYSMGRLEKLANKRRPGTTIVVGGCLTAIHPERINVIPDIIQVPTLELEQFNKIIQATIPMNTIPDPNFTIFDRQVATGHQKQNRNKKTHQSTETTDWKIVRTTGQEMYDNAKLGFKIRINWGCMGNCSYCVTKFAEQSLVSKPMDIILHEFQDGLQNGHTSFFFTGGDSGAYGLDCGTTIVQLLEAIFAIPGEYKIHFQDFGIHWLHKFFSELLPLFEQNRHRLGAFCFPIQSGSPKILSAMRRSTNIGSIPEILSTLKAKVPTIQIGTHLIVGFPGETETDFDQTVELVKNIPLDFCNIFQYTDHVRADSHHFPDKIPDSISSSRARKLFLTFQQAYSATH
jgi:MiaB/RimO family radical SAM methylthiotransferase